MLIYYFLFSCVPYKWINCFLFPVNLQAAGTILMERFGIDAAAWIARLKSSQSSHCNISVSFPARFVPWQVAKRWTEQHLLPLAAASIWAITSYTFTELVSVSRGQPDIIFFESFIEDIISRNMATFKQDRWLKDSENHALWIKVWNEKFWEH